MTIDTPVLDAHVHFWDPRSTPRRVSPAVKLLGWNERLLRTVGPRLFPRAAIDFVGRTDYVMNAYLPGDWRRDRGDVPSAGLVHVQAGWEGHGAMAPVGETRWLESLCGDELRGIVAQATLEAPELGALLDAHRAASPRVVGVRDMTAFDEDRGVLDWSKRGRMRTEAWQRGLGLLGERKLTFDAWCYHRQLGELAAAARTAPDTRVVLCHLGTPLGWGGPCGGYGGDEAARARIADEWRAGLAEVARCGNVHAKLSGLTMPVVGFGLHRRATPPSVGELVDRLGPLVEHALAMFGPERCFFASNFPMDKVSVPWTTLFAAFAQLVSGRDAATRRALFADNAARFYGLV